MFGFIISLVFIVGLCVSGWLILKKVRKNREDQREEDQRILLRQKRVAEILRLRGRLCRDNDTADELMLDRLWRINQDFEDDEVWVGFTTQMRRQMEMAFSRIFWLCTQDLDRRYDLLEDLVQERSPGQQIMLTNRIKELIEFVEARVKILEAEMENIKSLASDCGDQDLVDVLHRIRKEAAISTNTHTK